MANVSYIFGDILTGRIITEMPLQGVSIIRALGSGDLRAAFHLDRTGFDNQTVVDATIPGRCFIVCEREGLPIWGGIIRTRTYQSQAKIFQIYCRAFDHYPEYRIIRTDLSYTSVDQTTIFLNLWTEMMSDSNALQIELPANTPSGILKTLEVKDYEMKSYREAIDLISNADDGLDWSIDAVKVDNAYQWNLRYGYPQLGTTSNSTAIIFEYPGNILNYWKNEPMGNVGTHVYGIGAGEGDSMLLSEVIHTDLLNSGYPRYDTILAMKEISDSSLLISNTAQQAGQRVPPGTTITVEIKADLVPQFGTYGLGDVCKLVLKDPRHPSITTYNTRIMGWEYYPPSDEHIEEIRISFENTALAD